MRILKFIAIGGLAIIVVAGALLAFGLFGYKLNPVQRQISNKTDQWRELVPLDHKRLVDADVKTAHKWLASKGFEQSTEAQRVLITYPNPQPDWERQYEPLLADSTFIKSSGNLVCNLRFVVVLDHKYGKVEQAQGMVHESGCL